MKKKFGEEEIKILLDATFRIIGTAKEPDTNPEVRFLSLFMEQLVSTMIQENLKSDVSKQEQFNHVKAGYLALKGDIQEAVALAFQNSMQKFAKVPVEYYCVVKTVAKSNSEKNH